MQISSKLFNQQQLKQFSSTTEELQDLQNKIATGENILRASDDPVGSVELSGLNVVKKQIEQYERNVNSANDRLTLLDKNLENLSNIMIRAQELIIQASSDVLGASDREAIALEVDEMKEEIFLSWPCVSLWSSWTISPGASKAKAADSEEDDELLGVTPDGRKQSRVATAAKATKTHKATKAPKATKASKAYDKTDAGLEAEFLLGA